MRGVTVAIIIAMTCNVAIAEPTSIEMAAEVTDSVAEEYAECSAYFSIASRALAGSNKAETAKKYEEISAEAAKFSLVAAKQSRNESMATKVTLARIDMSLKEMLASIGHNYSNLSVISNRYMTPCLDAVRDSAPVIKRWTQKIQSKYDRLALPKKQ